MMTPEDRHVTGGLDTRGDVHVAALDLATGHLLGLTCPPPRGLM